MGKKSSSSFNSVFLGLRLEIERSGIHAVAQPFRPRAVREHVAEVSAALCTDRFGTDHAVAHVADLLDGAGDGLRKTRPAAARIELGVGVEQLGAAADAVVAAVGPDAFVLAAEGPLGGG